VRFIEQHATRTSCGRRWGVESICAQLDELGAPIAPSTYYDARRALAQPPPAALRDEALVVEIRRVHADNYGVYGARKVWLALNREGIPVARCTVERLMRALGLAGVRRGRRVRTTIPGEGVRARDLVGREFNPPAPDRLWVADFTYVATWSGMVYVAFVLDAYSRHPRVARRHHHAHQPGARRARAGRVDPRAARPRPPRAVDLPQRRAVACTSIAFTERLAEAGVAPSVGTIGDALDNALAESTIGLFKTELIRQRAPWRAVEQVEIATLEWVDWYNHRRLHSAAGDIPPAELEEAHYRQHRPHPAPVHSSP
jgi:putative transposase